MIALDFSKGNGLLPAIVQDFRSGRVLMLAYINQERPTSGVDHVKNYGTKAGHRGISRR